MANSNSGNDDALENFEQWRQTKADERAARAKAKAKETVPVVTQEETNAPVVPQEHVSPEASQESFFTSVWAWIQKAFVALVAIGKSGIAWIKSLFAGKDNSSANETTQEKIAAKKPIQKKVAIAEKPSVWAEVKAFFVSLRTKVRQASPRSKKITLVSVIAGAVLVVVIILFAKFEFVTVDAGIETSFGEAQGQTVLIEKGATINPNDLIVAVQPGGQEGAGVNLLMGTVFSSNDETYALFDGEVIWQVPLTDLKGKVVFATATQQLP